MDWYETEYYVQMACDQPYYYFDGEKYVEYRPQFGVTTPDEVIKQMRERRHILNRMCLARLFDPACRKGL